MPPKKRLLEPTHITISERDEAGNITATYIHSQSQAAGEKATANQRVDVIWPENPKSLSRRALDVFLPAGYPGSVTEDYLGYQIYDSLQAFASSIAGLLSSRAVLEGTAAELTPTNLPNGNNCCVGVGDANATPTNALYLSIIQESIGRIATIFFAHRFGTMIEPECKMYRLLADVLNDAAMILDCLSPAFPGGIRVAVLGGSSALRALCGVAAGSAKGCLSAHFATCGNLGELNAKDSSQETVISLFGMLVGSLVVSRITSPSATWILLLLLLAAHLMMNYLAVRAVSMRSLNQQRTNIVFSTVVDEGRVPGIQEVSQREHVFARTGALRWGGGKLLGTCCIGASLQGLLRRLGCGTVQQASSFRGLNVSLPRLLELFEGEKYILWWDAQRQEATIVLKSGAQPSHQVKAWVHALLMARAASKERLLRGRGQQQGTETMPSFTSLERTGKEVSRVFERYTADLEQAGWDFVGVPGLETRSGYRVVLASWL